MRSNLTGSLLGGLLLSDLLGYLAGAAEAAASAASTAPFYQLVHLSAHYNTLLGVLGALAIDQVGARGGAGRRWRGWWWGVPPAGELKGQPRGPAITLASTPHTHTPSPPHLAAVPDAQRDGRGALAVGHPLARLGHGL